MKTKKSEQRRQDIYLQQIREWRQKRTRPRKPGLGAREKFIFGELHPLAVWPGRFPVDSAKGVVTIRVPEIFSFIENPSQTLSALYQLRTAVEDPHTKEVFFDHSKCKMLDLCASVVTDVLLLRGKRARSFRTGNFNVGGAFSSEPEVNVLLKASGILKHLGVSEAMLPREVQERLKLCPLHSGRPSPPDETSECELAATRLVRFFDMCLSTEQHALKEEWKRKLISLTTEVLDNCEQHANRDQHWYTIGHFNRLPNEAGGVCHIAIFNFGDSILESLKRSDTPSTLKDRIAELAQKHRSRGFLGLGRPRWQEEALWTVYALQEGVSRFTDTPGGEDRGTGTVRMIQFFTELAGEQPRMAVISGRTYVLFDGTYKLQDKLIGGNEKRKIIAFNADNDLEKPPDEKYVRSLPLHFPGTLVSLRFILQREYLRRVREVVDERIEEN